MTVTCDVLLTADGGRLAASATVRAARALGPARVVTYGWSMGGSTAIRHAHLPVLLARA